MMTCDKCGGMRAAEKVVYETSSRRDVLSKCTSCGQYYLIIQTKTVVKEVQTGFCKRCNKEVPYRSFKDLRNWGAYERGEEDPDEYEARLCYYCHGTISSK